MALVLILALTVLLYIKTIDYNYIIDDIVQRDGYLYVVPESAPPPEFWKTKPSRWYRSFMILTHCANVTVVYLLWGWCPALLFAVHPLAVPGTAWVTGNYYATTALFCLTSYYFLITFPGIWSALLSMCLMAAAFNSTATSMSFPFFLSIAAFPWGMTSLIPLLIFLKGKRWTTGIEIRKKLASNPVVDIKMTWRRPVLMTKVVARYIFRALYPNKLGFFCVFGQGISAYQDKYDRIHSMNSEFWGSLLLCVTVAGVGFIIHPVATLWFFIIIGLHSQWALLGQFFAERYLYLAIVGLCVIVGSIIQSSPVVVSVVATVLVMRTLAYIPCWRNQVEIWENDIRNFPEYYATYNNAAQHFMSGGKLGPDEVNYVAHLLRKSENLKGDAWEVNMNIACFNYLIGYAEVSLEYTEKAIKLKEAVGGTGGPLKALLKQRDELLTHIRKKQEPRLGESLSPAQQTTTEQGGRDNGKSKSKTKERARVPKSNRKRRAALR